MKENNFIYLQSGGPTGVINCSAYGALSEALEHFDHVFAGLHGIEGLLADEVIEITKEDEDELELLKQTPGSAFGSCRKRLKDYKEDDSEYQELLKVLQKHRITSVAYNGGNDSMDTVYRFSSYLREKGISEVRIIGIPKTIDNDLMVTDHTPGYPSSARYIASTVSEIIQDGEAYHQGKVNIIEIMGRDAGWLTLASSLASLTTAGPDLICIPEVPFDLSSFLTEVKDIYKEKARAFAVVSEGIKDEKGNFIAASDKKDAFGHLQLGGAASYLASQVAELGLPVRSIELNIPQRADILYRSSTDIKEAEEAGRKAVRFLLNGVSGKMVTIVRKEKEGKYEPSYDVTSASEVADKIRYVPSSYYDERKHQATSAFYDYLLPLAGDEKKTVYKEKNGLIRYFCLNKLHSFSKI